MGIYANERKKPFSGLKLPSDIVTNISKMTSLRLILKSWIATEECTFLVIENVRFTYEIK